jgi:hypothetical protein
MKKTFFVSALFLFSFAFASNYPGDYAIKSTCQTQGPVKVCRSLQTNYNLAVVDVSYTGSLASSPDVKMWIQASYQDGPVSTTVSPVAQVPTVSPAAQVKWAEFRVTGGCMVGILGGCTSYGSPEMADVLKWAQQMDGKLNALEIDIAFTDDNSWDNNGVDYGTYHFSFAGE